MTTEFIEMVKSGNVESIKAYLMSNKVVTFEEYMAAIEETFSAEAKEPGCSNVRECLLSFDKFRVGGISPELMQLLIEAQQGNMNETDFLNKLSPEDMKIDYSRSVTLQLASRLGYLKVIQQYYPQLEESFRVIKAEESKSYIEQTQSNFDKSKHMDKTLICRTVNYMFLLANQSKNPDVLDYMIKKSMFSNNILQYYRVTFIACAITNGNLPVVKCWVDNGFDIKSENNIALFTASQYGHLDLVKWLKENGADIKARNDAALLFAAKNGHLSTVQWLVEQGSDFRAGYRAQNIAARNGHFIVLQWLRSQEADSINLDNFLMRNASICGDLRLLKWYQKQGADIKFQKNGPIRWAADQGHLPIVEWLAEQGADVRAENDQALTWAAKKNHLGVICYLVNVVKEIPEGIIVNDVNCAAFQTEIDSYINGNTLNGLEKRLDCYNYFIQMAAQTIVDKTENVDECVRLDAFKAQVVLGREKIEVKLSELLFAHRNAFLFEANPETNNLVILADNYITKLPKEVLNTIMSFTLNTSLDRMGSVRFKMDRLDGDMEMKMKEQIEKILKSKRKIELNETTETLESEEHDVKRRKRNSP